MTRIALALVVVLAACQPEDRSGTVQSWMFLRTPGTNDYALGVGAVEHLESLRELRGRDIDVRRGAALRETTAGLESDNGSAFSLEFTVDSNDAVLPADLDSFHAVTLYRNLDRIASLLRDHGHVPLRRLEVLYLPRVENVLLGDERLLITDNAAYVSQAKAFLVVPSFVLSALPMVLNEGVLAHEFGHAVIHEELFGDALEAPHADDSAAVWVVAHHHLAAMHEGVADVIGFAATGEPDFIKPTADVDRNMAEPRDFTQEMENDLEAVPQADQLFGTGFDPHAPGSILARAVFEAWPKDAGGKVSEAERGRLVDATLASLRRIRDEKLFREGFTLVDFLDGLALQEQGDGRKRVCAVFSRRFAVLKGASSVCPP